MNGKLKDLFFILILGSVCTAMLLGIQGYTQPKIRHYQEIKLKASILEAAGLNATQDNPDEVFKSKIKTIKKGDFEYYLSPGNLYIFEFKGRGLWGMIEGLIALNSDFNTIENIRIISQEETPGLGGRISEESFLDKFKKRKISPRLFLALRKKIENDNEVDAISGATITSQALINIINESVIDFRNKIGEPDAP